MGLFRRKPVATGTFRVVGVTEMDGAGRLILNGMPQKLVHVSGLVQVDGTPPEAFSVDQHFGLDGVPEVGQVVPVDVVSRSPLKIRAHWHTPAVDQRVVALQSDADAQVLQQLLATGRADHAPGQPDPVGIAFTDPAAAGSIADQLAAALGTPITVDVDEGGVKKHLTVGGGGHLSSAEAAALQQTGVAATATIRGGAQVNVPQAMLPGPGASLWDLTLSVDRPDGSSYDAATRVGFRSEARRQVLGLPGLVVPVRIDPADDSRVALDTATFDAQHPDAPPR